MKPVYQTRFGKDGNCFASCIASLLECDLSEVDYPMPDDDTWLRQWNDRLSERGLMFVEYAYSYNLPTLPDGCLLILCGESEGGLLHSAIGRYNRNGEDIVITCIHDPISPDNKAYLKDIKYIGYLAKCYKEAR